MELFKMNLLIQYETIQTTIDIYETDIEINSQIVYVIITTNKISGKQNTRFGNAIQTKSIINTYHLEKRFKL